VCAGLALATLPAVASGDVLVNAIEPTVVGCGQVIRPGIWYQSFSGGPRWAHMTIKTSSGRVVWHANATATTTWRYWRFRGVCGSRYRLTYVTARGRSTFPFHIRPADYS
jgi:hypothetical protein